MQDRAGVHPAAVTMLARALASCALAGCTLAGCAATPTRVDDPRPRAPTRAQQPSEPRTIDETTRAAALPRPIPRPPSELRSARLRELASALAPRLAALGRAAREPRRYALHAFQLGEELDAEMEGMARALLEPSPEDTTFYVRTEGIEPITLETVQAAFELEGEPSAIERANLVRLAEFVARLLQAHPELRVLAIRAGWADAVGAAYHGIALFDPATREALWAHASEQWSE